MDNKDSIKYKCQICGRVSLDFRLDLSYIVKNRCIDAYCDGPVIKIKEENEK
jgi:hypothetical protein